MPSYQWCAQAPVMDGIVWSMNSDHEPINFSTHWSSINGRSMLRKMRMLSALVIRILPVEYLHIHIFAHSHFTQPVCRSHQTIDMAYYLCSTVSISNEFTPAVCTGSTSWYLLSSSDVVLRNVSIRTTNLGSHRPCSRLLNSKCSLQHKIHNNGKFTNLTGRLKRKVTSITTITTIPMSVAICVWCKCTHTVHELAVVGWLGFQIHGQKITTE